jgi:HEAT repeat protein
MAKADNIDTQRVLESIYDAERTLRRQSDRLLHAPHGPLLDGLERGIASAGAAKDEDEQTLRLVCISRILRNAPGPKAVDLLIDILGSESEEARQVAGLVLEDVAFDRLGEVKKGIERARKRLPKGHTALCELPFVLLSFGEADTLELLRPFLLLDDQEAVAAAIEAMVELADPAGIPLIEPLLGDTRSVQVEDESTGHAEQFTLGDLATDALEALREVERIMASEAEG